MSLNRRGVTLTELVVALGVTGLVALLAARILFAAGWTLRDRSERMGSEHALRVAAGTLRAGLEALGQDSSTGSDLASLGSASFVARAARGAGVVCAVLPAALVVRAGADWWKAARAPVPGRDSLLVATPADTSWRGFALAAPPANASCPDGSPGVALAIAPDSLGLARVSAGAPLRLVEPVELRLYTSAPDRWLGLRLLATLQPIQPAAGPLGASGLGFSWLRRDGLPASLPAEVAAVAVQLGALTERPGGLGLGRGAPPRPDSVTVFVALPNQP